MSVLVGDLIISVRTLIPDMPGTLATPTTTFYAGAVADPNGTLTAASYYLRACAGSNWGVTSATPEFGPVGAGPGSAIIISGTFPPGAAFLRIYFGPQGAENQYVDVTSLPATINSPGTPGVVPTVNRAYLADADGSIYPAATVFGWLNDGLKQAGDLIGGIYDCTGVNTTEGIAMYPLLGDWKKMSHAWVDGWRFETGNKGEIFYRTKTTTSGGGIVVTDTRAARSIVEYYPIPDRTGGQDVVSAPIAATDSTINGTDLSNFLLQYGLALIGTPATYTTLPESCEIIAYQQINGNQLTYCLRGLGGTYPKAWPAGTLINELNGRFAGYRYPRKVRVGDGNYTLDIPPNWDTIIQLFIESRFMEGQRRYKESNELRNMFRAECRQLAASNRDMMGPKQVGETQVNEVYNAGLGGGWLLP